MSTTELKLLPVPSAGKEIPIVPLRDIVVYPNTLIPLFIGRESSINALKATMDLPESEQQVLLVTQKKASDKVSSLEGLYQVGTLANVLQLLKLSNGNAKAVVEGKQRCTLTSLKESDGYLVGQVEPLEVQSPSKKQEKNTQVLMRTVLEQFEQYINLNTKSIPVEIISILAELDDPDRLSDMIAMHLSLRTRDKQKLLEIFPVKTRLKKLIFFLERELEFLQIKKKVRKQFQDKMTKTQKEFFLKEQMEAIKSELADSQGTGKDTEKLAQAIKKAKMPKEVSQKAMDELKKLDMMPPISAEATVSRNYIDTLINLPWQQQTKSSYTLEKAEHVLNEGHYGLDKIKQHILEFLAVIKRLKKSKGFILCLVGPPGVGKTSLGQSVAKAMGLKFMRISLGGVRDEAEIRGHRRTYIGAMPGQIMQKLAKVKTKNPLFMLDEIDKMAMDFRGDPASALLEVLDPDHNHSFTDHYLEVPFDLSEVLFMATANSIEGIPPALLDRMEVIRISGYTEDEKMRIAQDYLLPKQTKENGLKEAELSVDHATLIEMIRYYTLEAGVRNLERETAKLCRKVVMQISKQKEPSLPVQVTPNNLEDYLGIKRFRYGLAHTKDEVGEVNGLAWTAARGELLKIESAVMPGKGKISYTGHLGDVMQESIQTAFNVVRVRAKQFGISENFYEKMDIHVHIPEGATPKDGPSAGIGICTALFSSLTDHPVRADVAMTGEVTLLGRVLPIGGLKEKLLAAHQSKIRLVIIPKENERDLKEIPDKVKEDLEIHLVESVEEVLNLAFRTPLTSKNEVQDKVAGRSTSQSQQSESSQKAT